MSPHYKSMYNKFSMTFSRSGQRRTDFELPFRLQLVLDVSTEKLILKNGKVAAPVFTEPVQFILKIGRTLRISDAENDIYALELPRLTFDNDSMLQFV